MLASRIGLLRPPRGLMLEAIARGWLFLRPIRTAIFVGFNPYFVTDQSLFRLYRLLIEQKPGRVVISSDQRLLSYELTGGPARAIVRIEEIVADARRPQPAPLLRAEPLALYRLHQIENGRLIPILQLWHAANGRWRPEISRYPERTGAVGMHDDCAAAACLGSARHRPLGGKAQSLWQSVGPDRARTRYGECPQSRYRPVACRGDQAKNRRRGTSTRPE